MVNLWVITTSIVTGLSLTCVFRHARDLEFEAAAKLRDEMQRIRRVGLGMPG